MTSSITSVSSSSSGTVSSPGLSTGLDVNTLVTQLVNADISAQQTRLTTQGTADQAKISALGLISSDLSSLQSSLSSFLTGGALTKLTASSSNTSLVTVSASSSAVAGNYQVSVTQLAAANSITSGAFSSASAEVGTGTLTIHAGGSSFQVTLASGSDSLGNLRDAINNSSSNTGVSATIITGTDGAHLLLTSTKTGVSNAVSMDSNSLISFNTVQAASDASIQVAGINYTGPSNTISDAIQGVTLNLVGASANTNLTVSVSTDTSGASAAAQSFVSNYNTLLSLLNSDIQYDASTQTAGPLLGNVPIQSLFQKMQSIVGSTVSGDSSGINSLAQIGITANKDGSLSFNSTLFNSVLKTNQSAVQNLLSGTSSVSSQLNSLANGYVGTSGMLQAQSNGLQTEVTNITNQLTALSSRKTYLTDLYTKKFNAINASMSKYNNLSAFLTQTFTTKSSSSSG